MVGHEWNDESEAAVAGSRMCWRTLNMRAHTTINVGRYIGILTDEYISAPNPNGMAAANAIVIHTYILHARRQWAKRTSWCEGVRAHLTQRVLFKCRTAHLTN